MTIVLVCLVALSVSVMLTGLLRIYALKQRLLDIPNDRSSHQVSTPRGGGLASVVIFLLALFFFYLQGMVEFELFVALFGGGSLVAVIGFWDDHGHIPIHWRMLVHVFAATWVLIWLGGLPVIPIGGASVDFGWLGVPLGVLLVVWLLNLFNFMDGIDGIAGMEAVFISVSASILIISRGSLGVSVLILLVLASATLGFLFWNWPPAKIFLGDVGSGFLGLVLGALALATSLDQHLPLWSWLILFGAFLVDATVTLIRRIFRGDRWYEAHRSHAYQIASRLWGSHKKVTLTVMAINVFWLFPFAVGATLWPNFGIVLLILSYLPLVFLVLKLDAGNSRASNI